MSMPFTSMELLRSVAIETSRMSYPSSMSRGKKPVVSGGTKKNLELHFANNFPMEEIWSSADSIARDYDEWHYKQVEKISRVVQKTIKSNNVEISVAAKFLNTFMHQLMKYEEARPLLRSLHLPLDRKIFLKLQKIESPALSTISKYLDKSPYSLKYQAHKRIQVALLSFIEELNERAEVEIEIKYRIHLNWLWL